MTVLLKLYDAERLAYMALDHLESAMECIGVIYMKSNIKY